MKKYDILKDDIYFLIKQIAIPASIGSIFVTLYNVVDTIFAGQVGLNGEGLAGVSITFPLFLLLLSISIGLGAGTTALVGNSIGSKDNQMARHITYNSLILTVIISILAVALLYPLLPSILRFMKVAEEVLPYSLSYIRVLYLGVLTFTVSGVINSVLSAQGLTKPYRNVLILGFFLNIILDPLLLGKNPLYFIGKFLEGLIKVVSFGSIEIMLTFKENIEFLPNLGTAGIAIATISIQIFQMVYMMHKLRKSPLFDCEKSIAELKVEICVIKDILKQGIPAMLNMMTITTGIFILNYFVSYIGGKSATAALGLGYRIEQLVMLPASGVYVAMVAIISQNKGAKNYSRVYETFKKGLKLSLSMLILGSIFIYILKFYLISIFTLDEEITRIAVEYLKIEVFTLPAYAVLSVSANTLQAIKRPKVAMYGTLLRQFIMPLTLYSLVTFYFKFPIRSIWICVFINAWSIGIFLLIYTKKLLKFEKSN